MSGIKRKAATYLDKLGFKHSNQGFGYLVTAIALCAENPVLKNTMMELYASVGNVHVTTAARAERSIRHAIGCSNHGEHITNGEFICRAVDELITYAEAEPK